MRGSAAAVQNNIDPALLAWYPTQTPKSVKYGAYSQWNEPDTIHQESIHEDFEGDLVEVAEQDFAAVGSVSSLTRPLLII